MGITYFEAAKRARLAGQLGVAGQMLAIATSDQMTSMLEVRSIGGDAEAIVREGSLGADPTFADINHVSIVEGTGTEDIITARLRLLLGDADVPMFVQEQMNGMKMAQAIALKLKATGRVIANKLINGSFAGTPTLSAAMAGVTMTSASPHQDSGREGQGDLRFTLSGTTLAYRAPGDANYGPAVTVPAGTNTLILGSENPSKNITVSTVFASLPGANAEVNVTIPTSSNEPDGLNRLIDPGQVISSVGANGDALSFAVLDRLLDEMVKTNGNKVFIGNAKMKAKFKALIRSVGGTSPDHLALPGLNGQVAPSYLGVPFIQNDWIASNEVKGADSALSSLYLVDLKEEEGGLFGLVGGGGTDFEINKPPVMTRTMGVRVRNLGELEAKEHVRTRISWYGCFALGSKFAAARAREIVTA